MRTADPQTCTAPKGNKIYVLDADTGALLTSFSTARSVVADVVVIPDSTGRASIRLRRGPWRQPLPHRYRYRGAWVLDDDEDRSPGLRDPGCLHRQPQIHVRARTWWRAPPAGTSCYSAPGTARNRDSTVHRA